MTAIPSLEERWVRRSQCVLSRAAIEFDDTGLSWGAGVVLAPLHKNALGCDVVDIDRHADRIIAFLSIVQDRAAPSHILGALKAAAACWQRGDKAMAAIRLAQARLPRLSGEADDYRLFLADIALKTMSPRRLLEALKLEAALDFLKYDSKQPRVPAGSGRASGRWGSGGGGESQGGSDRPLQGDGVTEGRSASRALLEGAPSIAARSVAPTVLSELGADAMAALSAFALRFSGPTAFFGTLFIPTPNGMIDTGTLPNSPDVSYRLDKPEGRLTLTAKGDDDRSTTVIAQNERGLYVDVETKQTIGRTVAGGDRLVFDEDAVKQSFAARRDAKIKAGAETAAEINNQEPKFCPDAVPDKPHENAEAERYENEMKKRVNPGLPTPSGYGYMFINPKTGRPVFLDDCFREGGDHVDRDMRNGDFADGKADKYERLLTINEKLTESVEKKLLEQAERQTDITRALGVELKWYMKEEKAASLVRKLLEREFPDIKVVHFDPTRPTTKLQRGLYAWTAL